MISNCRSNSEIIEESFAVCSFHSRVRVSFHHVNTLYILVCSAHALGGGSRAQHSESLSTTCFPIRILVDHSNTPVHVLHTVV